MATFIVLRHPVTILVTAFTNPNNLNKDIFIVKLLIFGWGVIAKWISHLLTVPSNLGSKPGGGKN